MFDRDLGFPNLESTHGILRMVHGFTGMIEITSVHLSRSREALNPKP